MRKPETLSAVARCARDDCGHTVISHDLDRKAMPCRMPGCPCEGFTDRGRL